MEKPPRTVAIIEDDQSMRKSVERLLGASGYRTEGYASAEHFLNREERSSTISCMVIDIHLGGMSGIELRQYLAASQPDIGVIFITAVDDEFLESQAVQAGCVAYLLKPFAASLLLAAIDRVLK